MSGVRDFVYSLLIVSVSCSVVTMIMPENPRVSKYLNFLISIVVTSVLLFPLCNALSKLPQLNTVDIEVDAGQADLSLYTDAILKEACVKIEDEVRDMLKERFDTEPEDVNVISNNDHQALKVEEITVVYSVDKKLLFSDTVNYIKDLFGTDCEVRVVYEDT